MVDWQLHLVLSQVIFSIRTTLPHLVTDQYPFCMCDLALAAKTLYLWTICLLLTLTTENQIYCRTRLGLNVVSSTWAIVLQLMNQTKLEYNCRLIYLGVTLDRSLIYRANLHKLAQKVRTMRYKNWLALFGEQTEHSMYCFIGSSIRYCRILLLFLGKEQIHSLGRYATSQIRRKSAKAMSGTKS